MVAALRRWRALSSNTSLVNRRVTSIITDGSRPVSLYSLISGRALVVFIFAGLLAECGNRKTHDDGVVIGGLHGQRDRRLGVRHHLVIYFPEIDLVYIALPADHPLGHKLSAVADPQSGARNLRHEEELPV